MKYKNIRTLENLLIEYGLQPGVSTPVGQQKTGIVAKATSPTVKSTSPSPTIKPGTPNINTAKPPVATTCLLYTSDAADE